MTRVLVTGVASDLGSSLARSLAADRTVTRVLGVDTRASGALDGVEVVRADIRHPTLARILADARIDTVVHLGVLPTPVGSGGRAGMKEANVIGTMQLLAACERAPGVRRLVVRSRTAVYGASSRDPAVFVESTPPQAQPGSGFARDIAEIEGYVRGFARRRPGVAVTVLRFAPLLGADVDSSLTRYLRLPVVPTLLGYDPRLQVLHPSDALAVLRRAAGRLAPAGEFNAAGRLAPAGEFNAAGRLAPAGEFNVAGEGVLLLSQALRRLGAIAVPTAPPLARIAGAVLRGLRLTDFSPDRIREAEHGRVVDTTALRSVFGYRPRLTTAAAFEEFARAHPGPLRRHARDGHVGLRLVRSVGPADV